MKRPVSFFIAIAILSLSNPSFAGTARKFQDGIWDVITSPLQITGDMKAETANAKFLPFALVGGFLKGTFYMAKQIVTGTFDVVTAPLDMIPSSVRGVKRRPPASEAGSNP